MNNSAKPLKTIEIRNIAQFIRKKLVCSNDDESIDMIALLDTLTSKLSKYGFNYYVLEDNDPIFEYDDEAKTDIIEGNIYFKESVIKEADSETFSRANFTIAHEIGHFILHRVVNPINFSRTASFAKMKCYEDPEWQANTFASEFLMPYESCMNLTPKQIKERFHVTMAAANVRYQKIHRNQNDQDACQHLDQPLKI